MSCGLERSAMKREKILMHHLVRCPRPPTPPCPTSIFVSLNYSCNDEFQLLVELIPSLCAGHDSELLVRDPVQGDVPALGPLRLQHDHCRLGPVLWIPIHCLDPDPEFFPNFVPDPKGYDINFEKT